MIDSEEFDLDVHQTLTAELVTIQYNGTPVRVSASEWRAALMQGLFLRMPYCVADAFGRAYALRRAILISQRISTTAEGLYFLKEALRCNLSSGGVPMVTTALAMMGMQ